MATKVSAKAETAKSQEEYLNERVPFMAALVKKDDPTIFVSVNGRNFLIQRGKTVMIPRYVLHHLKAVERQKGKIMMLQLSLQDKVDSQQLR